MATSQISMFHSLSAPRSWGNPKPSIWWFQLTICFCWFFICQKQIIRPPQFYEWNI